MAHLCDGYLINNCKALKPESFPKFITPSSKESLQKLIASCPGPNDNIPSKTFVAHHTLWKELLGDAITFLKHNDTREHSIKKEKPERDRVAFGIDDLYKYFEEYQDFEALLYGADKFYRDHIIHLFRVWFLGLWLIERFGGDIQWDKEPSLKTNEALDISEDEVSAMWCLIALTHDLGYPLDKVEKVRTKIDAMMRYFGGGSSSSADFQIPSHHHFINDFILKFISSKLTAQPGRAQKDSFQTSIQSKFYLKFSKSLENFKHGIVTCILLMKNLVYFLESDLDLTKTFKEPEDARQFYIRREILRSIASHTSTDIYHLYPNSLALILILADELQVWDRPTFPEMKGGQQDLELSVGLPEISKEMIQIEFNIVEKETPGAENGGGKNFFYGLCRKWHKWLRSALDAKERIFKFHFGATITPETGPIKPTKYLFINEPLNVVEISIDGVKQDILEELYPLK